MPSKDLNETGRKEFLARELIAFAAITAGCFALLSLWTAHAGDISESYYPRNSNALNRGGAVGAHLAHGLCLWMGALAPYLLAAISLLWGIRIFLGRTVRGLWVRIPIAALFLLSICTVEAMVGYGGAKESGVLDGHLPGGIYGTHIAGLLRPAFGGLPSLALVTVFGGIALAGTAGGVPSWSRRLAGRVTSISLPTLRRDRDDGAEVAVDGDDLDAEEELASLVKDFKPKKPKIGPSRPSSRPARETAEDDDDDAEEISTKPTDRIDRVEAEEIEDGKEGQRAKTDSKAETGVIDRMKSAIRTRKGKKAKKVAGEPEAAAVDADGTADPEVTDDSEVKVVAGEEDGTQAVEVLPAPVITGLTAEEKAAKKAKEKADEADSFHVPEAPEGEFVLPPLSLLEPPEEIELTSNEILLQQAEILRRTLESFKVTANVSEIQRGPAITMYELELAPGIKVNKIVSLSDDLAMALKAQCIRVVYPIPGKSTVGIEVPNPQQEVVRLRELIESDEYRKKKFAIPFFIGKDNQGKPVIHDLAKMPHLLIAGQTGSGKSVCLNSIILSLLFTRKPDEVRMILVDPKQVELMQYENLPNLLTPVVTDMKKAPAVLHWVVNEMEKRYERMAKVGVRHINSFNALSQEEREERLPDELRAKGLAQKMPFIVVVVDELADLMMVASREVEESIIRLAQKSRAVGIHVVLATQRPSADVITGLIKSNLPCRIAFQVASRVDSRTILDRNGAEKLTGSGDCLFLPPGSSNPSRSQGTYIGDGEIRRTVSTIRQGGEPVFHHEIEDFDPAGAVETIEAEHDELFDRAVEIILETGRGSASLLQRRLEIGYTRASRLIDIMEKKGVVGSYKGSKAREILITLEEWESMRSESGGEASGRSVAPEDLEEPDDDEGHEDND